MSQNLGCSKADPGRMHVGRACARVQVNVNMEVYCFIMVAAGSRVCSVARRAFCRCSCVEMELSVSSPSDDVEDSMELTNTRSDMSLLDCSSGTLG